MKWCWTVCLVMSSLLSAKAARESPVVAVVDAGGTRPLCHIWLSGFTNDVIVRIYGDSREVSSTNVSVAGLTHLIVPVAISRERPQTLVISATTQLGLLGWSAVRIDESPSKWQHFGPTAAAALLGAALTWVGFSIQHWLVRKHDRSKTRKRSLAILDSLLLDIDSAVRNGSRPILTLTSATVGPILEGVPTTVASRVLNALQETNHLILLWNAQTVDAADVLARLGAVRELMHSN